MTNLLKILFLSVLLIPRASNATVLLPDTAISNVRAHCGQISNSFRSLKQRAQINTVVTGVGTVAGAGATIAGFAKAKTDKTIEELIQRVKNAEATNPNRNTTTDTEFIDSVLSMASTSDATITNDDIDELDNKSRRLGNLRTGLLIGNTATNITGTIIAANNRTNGDLRTQLELCNSALRDLHDSKMQAQIDGIDALTISKMTDILTACREYDSLDISKIDNRATGAAISSGIGAGIGLAGAITSAAANSNKIRNDNSDAGIAKEKNLNTASNILAIGTTAASGTATVFNATQISAINQAYKIAQQCSEALSQ